MNLDESYRRATGRSATKGVPRDGSRPFGDRNTLWVIHIGKDDRMALRARDEGFVCIGWTKMGDLSRYPTREQLKEAMAKTWPDWKINKVRASYGQVYRFAHEMKIGDPLVLPIKQTREVAIGRISGEYRFMSEGSEFHTEGYGNLRDVEWLKVVPRTLFSKSALHSFGSFSSVSTSDDHLEEVLAILQGEIPSEAEEEPATQATAMTTNEEEDETPDLYETATQETEDYLLKAWHRTGAHFEHVVAAVLRAMGYTANVTQASGDHGIDVIAHPDALGLEKPYIKVQVKSGTSTTGEPQVNQLKGGLNDGEQGIVVSLGGYASGAHTVARSSANITLIDAKQFVSLFLEHYDKLDPSWQARYPLKRAYVPAR